MLSGAKICAGAHVHKAIIGENAVVGKDGSIGIDGKTDYLSKYCSGGVSLVGSDVHIGVKVHIAAGSMVTEDVKGGTKQ